MIKWNREVKPLKELDPLEAFPVDMALLFIKGAIESAVKGFAENDDGATIVYRNGLNGTEYDCFENYHLPIFAIYKFGYCDPIAMLCYSYSKLTGTTNLKVYHRKSLEDKFEEFEVSAYPYSMSAEEWREIANAFESAFDDKQLYNPIWAESEEEVDAI